MAVRQVCYNDLQEVLEIHRILEEFKNREFRNLKHWGMTVSNCKFKKLWIHWRFLFGAYLKIFCENYGQKKVFFSENLWLIRNNVHLVRKSKDSNTENLRNPPISKPRNIKHSMQMKNLLSTHKCKNITYQVHTADLWLGHMQLKQKRGFLK